MWPYSIHLLHPPPILLPASPIIPHRDPAVLEPDVASFQVSEDAHQSVVAGPQFAAEPRPNASDRVLPGALGLLPAGGFEHSGRRAGIL